MARIYHILGVALLALSMAVPAVFGSVSHTPTDISVNFDGEATEFELKIEVAVTEAGEAGEYTVTLTNPTEHTGFVFEETTLTKSVSTTASKVYTFNGNATEDAEEGSYKFLYTVTGPNNYTESGEISVELKAWKLPCYDWIYAPAAGVVLMGAIWTIRRK